MAKRLATIDMEKKYGAFAGLSVGQVLAVFRASGRRIGRRQAAELLERMEPSLNELIVREVWAYLLDSHD